MFSATVHILVLSAGLPKYHEFSLPIKLGRQKNFAHFVPLCRQKRSLRRHVAGIVCKLYIRLVRNVMMRSWSRVEDEALVVF